MADTLLFIPWYLIILPLDTENVCIFLFDKKIWRHLIAQILNIKGLMFWCTSRSYHAISNIGSGIIMQPWVLNL